MQQQVLAGNRNVDSPPNWFVTGAGFNDRKCTFTIKYAGKYTGVANMDNDEDRGWKVGRKSRK
jgi:hypothetical protein